MPKPSKHTTIVNDTGTILSRQGVWQAATVMISSSDVTADADGRKVVLAGTILGSAESGGTVLRSKAKAKPANDATSEGLTMNTVDVTNGDMEVAMLYMGTVGLNRIPAAPTDEAYTALNRITFTED